MSLSDATQQSELALLGSVMLDNSLWSRTEGLTIADFSLTSHQTIFSAMAAMREDGRAVDTTTLTAELAQREQLEAIGGHAYIGRLIDFAMPENFDAYVRTVRTDSISRQWHRRWELMGNTRDFSLLMEQLDHARELLADESLHGGHIRTLADIPDPFSLPGGEIEWLVDGLIPKGGVTLLISDPGCGKTWLAHSLAKAASLGGQFLERQALRMPVLYLDRENPLALVRERLTILCGGPGVFNPWGTWCQEEPPLLGDSRLLNFAKQGSLIIFDSLIRFHDADENSASEMRVVMGHLRSLAAAGATVFALHHKGKSSIYRGSTDIIGAVDVGFNLSRTDDGLLEMSTVGVKNRMGPDIRLTVRPDFAAGQFPVVEAPALVRTRHEMETLCNIIRETPGLSSNKIIERSGISRQRALSLLERGNGSAWMREHGPQKSHLYRPI